MPSEEQATSERSYEVLWQDAHRHWYECIISELALGSSIRVRRQVSMGMQFFLMATAAGSGIATWSVWQYQTGKVIWSVVAAIATVIGLVKSIWRMDENVAGMMAARSDFQRMRSQWEEIKLMMRQGESVDSIQQLFQKRLEELQDIRTRNAWTEELVSEKTRLEAGRQVRKTHGEEAQEAQSEPSGPPDQPRASAQATQG